MGAYHLRVLCSCWSAACFMCASSAMCDMFATASGHGAGRVRDGAWFSGWLFCVAFVTNVQYNWCTTANMV